MCRLRVRFLVVFVMFLVGNASVADKLLLQCSRTSVTWSPYVTVSDDEKGEYSVRLEKFYPAGMKSSASDTVHNSLAFFDHFKFLPVPEKGYSFLVRFPKGKCTFAKQPREALFTCVQAVEESLNPPFKLVINDNSDTLIYEVPLWGVSISLHDEVETYVDPASGDNKQTLPPEKALHFSFQGYRRRTSDTEPYVTASYSARHYYDFHECKRK